MSQQENFDKIRPFEDNEVSDVINQLVKVPYFIHILPRLFPNVPVDVMVEKLKQITSIAEFQDKCVIPFIKNLLTLTSKGLTVSGIENVNPQRNYLFISNHRDIVLDSALINTSLRDKGLNTSQIAIGDNLLIYEWITDLVKLNKSFLVLRNLSSVRQQMEASATLSAYIRTTIVDNKQNIWLAQREGRSKDGNDETQNSVLKMLNLSGKEDFVDNFAKLQILPVSISYEYDPCDYLKAFQFQLKRDNPAYKKSQNDDLEHMSIGIRGQKGGIHISFNKEITDVELRKIQADNKNAQIQELAKLIDHDVHNSYYLWPSNYIAFDELNNSSRFADKYTAEEKAAFDNRNEENIAKLGECDKEFVLKSIRTMYANPVINKLKY
ncbi:MAG: 1-acyl-sn-glycerol-3-phosphate acyltransferase [Marinilabiliaceae bacterium]|nr:1-acyl-sn-glycerol-3-phosphate acyltransferase [Marinilabiliaceae bacterium]